MALTVGTVITGAAVVHLSASTHHGNPRRLIAAAAPPRGAGAGSAADSAADEALSEARDGGLSTARCRRIAAPPGVMPGAVRAPRARMLARGSTLPVGAPPALPPFRWPPRAAIHDAGHRRRAQQRFSEGAGCAESRCPARPRGPAKAGAGSSAEGRPRAAGSGRRIGLRDRAGPWAPPRATAPRAAPTRAAPRGAPRKGAPPAAGSRAPGPVRDRGRARRNPARAARKARAAVAHRADRVVPAARNPRAANSRARWWARSCTKSAASSNTCCTEGDAPDRCLSERFHVRTGGAPPGARRIAHAMANADEMLSVAGQRTRELAVPG